VELKPNEYEVKVMLWHKPDGAVHPHITHGDLDYVLTVLDVNLGNPQCRLVQVTCPQRKADS
jgi:hypothetical protein